MMIDTKKILNEEFLTQEFTPLQGNADALGRFGKTSCLGDRHEHLKPEIFEHIIFTFSEKQI